MIVLWDVLRVVVAAAGFLIGAHSIYMATLVPTWGQRCRFIGVVMAMLIICGSRVQNLGGPVTWQLLVSVVMVGVLGYGSWSFAREVPAQKRETA